MDNLCDKCGGNHLTADCGAIGAGTGAPTGGPDDSDLASLGGGGSWSTRKKTAIGGVVGLAVVGLVAGVIALRGRSDGAAKAGKAAVAAATAAAPTGDKVTLGCTVTSVTTEYVEAKCEWAKNGGVSFADLRWDGDVLKGTLVVTLTDDRLYRSEKEVEAKVGAKTPTTFLAQR